MNKAFTLLICSLLLAGVSNSSAAQDWQREDYSLSMAGALINDHCGKVWQDGEYISVHACNYKLANRFSLTISTRHFDECTVLANGDIVMIADCMVERFNAWLVQQEQ